MKDEILVNLTIQLSEAQAAKRKERIEEAIEKRIKIISPKK